MLVCATLKVFAQTNEPSPTPAISPFGPGGDDGQVGMWSSQAGDWRAVGARFDARVNGQSEMGVVCMVNRESEQGTFTLFQRRVDRPVERLERGFLYNRSSGVHETSNASRHTQSALVVLRAGDENFPFHPRASKLWTDGPNVGGILSREDLQILVQTILNNDSMLISYRGPLAFRPLQGEVRVALDGARVALDMMIHCNRVMTPLRLPEE
jgi:hypothetical protein